LLAMAAIGYYLRIFGGSWGGAAQVLFDTAVIVLLAIVLFSGRARARLRKFVNENFYEYQYNYREEWLRFTECLSEQRPGASVEENAVRAIAQIIESPRGQLWLRNTNGDYTVESHWHMPEKEQSGLLSDAGFLRLLEKERRVIDIIEWREHPDKYLDQAIPEQINALERIWLVVPLLLRDELYGFVSLTRSRSKAELGWEDRDLLLTVGQQAASFLALRRVSHALAEAKQFETFNRLSAFIVHDLKNIVAQLGLVVTNSRRYRDNQDFIDDAFSTTENAVNRMNRLLAHLRKDRGAGIDSSVSIDVCEVAELAVKSRSATNPVPKLCKEISGAWISGDRDYLIATLENLIQNAQEACSKGGAVTMTIRRNGASIRLVISDSGHGMDEKFIRERLFKPFDTTKGNAGMGIGAYEAREFVKTLGGSLKVSSVPGQGTEVFIELPAEISHSKPNSTGLSLHG
jgi:putative PEP-CTERM system histidine kinase